MGRRKPLIWGAFACGICFLLVCPTKDRLNPESKPANHTHEIQAGVLQKDITPVRAKASLAFFFLYEAIFAIGWLPIPWLFVRNLPDFRNPNMLIKCDTAPGNHADALSDQLRCPRHRQRLDLQLHNYANHPGRYLQHRLENLYDLLRAEPLLRAGRISILSRCI